jgi:hypothetical protein
MRWGRDLGRSGVEVDSGERCQVDLSFGIAASAEKSGKEGRARVKVKIAREREIRLMYLRLTVRIKEAMPTVRRARMQQDTAM